jgi:hypothetical protein
VGKKTKADERRKYKRFKIKTMTRLNNTSCSIINVSKEGMLLTGSLEASPDQMNIQLKINGQWVDLKAKRMWVMENPKARSKRMGVFITQAPAEYDDFVNNLYLEADTKNK